MAYPLYRWICYLSGYSSHPIRNLFGNPDPPWYTGNFAQIRNIRKYKNIQNFVSTEFHGHPSYGRLKFSPKQLVRNSFFPCDEIQLHSEVRRATSQVTTRFWIFGSACHVKKDSTFFWPLTLKPVFYDLNKKIIPLSVPKKHIRLYAKS